ncbi:MAG: SRPBCC family protein [Rhizobacter sp.]|nr:SRPBCC family protein [Bacteriovorax sp.]
MKNTIEKQIEINAPVTKVWSALTEAEKFGDWFKVNFTGKKFEAGKQISGQTTYPGMEHIKMEFVIKDIKPEFYFSLTWHPFAVKPDIDYSNEIPTLVEFKLEKTATGTLVTVTESGFDNIPAARRDEAFEMHTGGWEEQLKNIQNYVGR